MEKLIKSQLLFIKNNWFQVILTIAIVTMVLIKYSLNQTLQKRNKKIK